MALFLMWQVGRIGPSFETQVATLAINVFGFALSQIIATLVCRAFGYSLARQTETRLEAQPESLLPESVELRSYEQQSVFKILAWLCLALQGADVLLLFFAWVRVHFYSSYSYRYQLEHWYLVPLFTLSLAGFFALMSYRARCGSFVAKVGSEGIEIQKAGQVTGVNWSEIESAVKVESANIFGDVTYSYVDLKDVKGKVRTRVTLNNSPIERQQQFSGVLSRYLSPPPLV